MYVPSTTISAFGLTASGTTKAEAMAILFALATLSSAYGSVWCIVHVITIPPSSYMRRADISDAAIFAAIGFAFYALARVVLAVAGQ